jgi:hypothetical protein
MRGWTRRRADPPYRGPEVETWLGAEEGSDPATENDWGLLPFMALSDGAHAYVHLDTRIPTRIVSESVPEI